MLRACGVRAKQWGTHRLGPGPCLREHDLEVRVSRSNLAACSHTVCYFCLLSGCCAMYKARGKQVWKRAEAGPVLSAVGQTPAPVSACCDPGQSSRVSRSPCWPPVFSLVKRAGRRADGVAVVSVTESRFQEGCAQSSCSTRV